MKKILLVFSLILLSFMMISCEKKLKNEIKIITPAGTPYLAIGGLLDEKNISIEAVNGAANLQTALVANEYDIVIAPINLGAQLYKKGNSKYQAAAIITQNNAYLVAKDGAKLDSWEDLKGEKVIAFGQTGIPGKLLTNFYNSHEELNIDDVSFVYSSSVECYSAFITSSEKYALISEPEVSKLKLVNDMSVKTYDLTQDYGDVPQACVFVNPKSNKESIDLVLKMISDNIKYLNDNASKYANEVVKLERRFEVMGVELIKTVIPTINIVYQKASDAKTKEAILRTLNLVGAPNPGEEFYY